MVCFSILLSSAAYEGERKLNALLLGNGASCDRTCRSLYTSC
jgi:hypothetical protein